MYRLCVIVSYLSKVADFNLLYLQLVPPFGGDAIWISPRSLASANCSSWAIVWHCLCDPVFICSDTIPACNTEMDRWTHGDSIYHASIELHSKNYCPQTFKYTHTSYSCTTTMIGNYNYNGTVIMIIMLEQSVCYLLNLWVVLRLAEVILIFVCSL